MCHSLDGYEALRLEDVPTPSMGELGDVRIAVHAAGLNFADTLVVQGRYQVKPALPFTPGMEVAGEVIEVASHVTDVNVGQRVMAIVGHGGYSEQVVAPHSTVYPIPDTMDWQTAAGFPIVYGTAHAALCERARLLPDETLLVHGAAGGVGLAAVEIGKCLGATVIATAGGPDKLAIAKQYGADHLIDYRTSDVRDCVLDMTEKRGVDVVFDPVGGAIFDASLRVTASGGRILLIGFASGTVPQIPANIMLVKNVDVMGIHFSAMRQDDPVGVQRSFATLLQWFQVGDLRPHVSQTFALEDALDALTMLVERRSTGKVILKIQ
jgi:NADPH2:quinone reductase